jgi:hypothetical protein
MPILILCVALLFVEVKLIANLSIHNYQEGGSRHGKQLDEEYTPISMYLVTN